MCHSYPLPSLPSPSLPPSPPRQSQTAPPRVPHSSFYDEMHEGKHVKSKGTLTIYGPKSAVLEVHEWTGTPWPGDAKKDYADNSLPGLIYAMAKKYTCEGNDCLSTTYRLLLYGCSQYASTTKAGAKQRNWTPLMPGGFSFQIKGGRRVRSSRSGASEPDSDERFLQQMGLHRR